MANQEVTLMKGNEAIAHACIRCGADGFFGYPITPQSEIIETLALLKPWETSGMVVLQAESEVAAINMVYGGAGAGKRVITTSSSPGVALMQEGISYMAGAEIPGVIVNVHGYRYVEAAVPEACVGCTSCAIVCPDGCITVYRKKED